MTLNDYLKRLRKVEFRMKTRSHEALSGTYHSAFKGRGMLFSECRTYEEGDDVRYIDWNASARQNGVFVKQYEEERELNVCVIVDLSRPMRFGSIGMTKAEKAIEAMSIIAYSALVNNDKVSLFLFNEVGEQYIPPMKGKGNVVRLILEALKFSPQPGVHHLGGVMTHAITLMKRRTLVFLISDYIGEEYERILRHLAHRHEVIPIIVSDVMEYEMPDMGLALLEDAFTGEFIPADTHCETFTKQYRKVYEERIKKTKSVFEHLGLSYVNVKTTEDIVVPIWQVFERRARHV